MKYNLAKQKTGIYKPEYLFSLSLCPHQLQPMLTTITLILQFIQVHEAAGMRIKSFSCL